MIEIALSAGLQVVGEVIPLSSTEAHTIEESGGTLLIFGADHIRYVKQNTTRRRVYSNA